MTLEHVPTHYNWRVFVSSPAGDWFDSFTYMRSQAERILAYYQSLGWSGRVEPIER